MLNTIDTAAIWGEQCALHAHIRRVHASHSNTRYGLPVYMRTEFKEDFDLAFCVSVISLAMIHVKQRAQCSTPNTEHIELHMRTDAEPMATSSSINFEVFQLFPSAVPWSYMLKWKRVRKNARSTIRISCKFYPQISSLHHDSKDALHFTHKSAHNIELGQCDDI